MTEILLPGTAACACKPAHLELEAAYIGPAARDSAILDLRRWGSMEAYRAGTSQKPVRYPARKAGKLGYRCTEFGGSGHNVGIEAVNRSLPERQGRQMSESYLSPIAPGDPSDTAPRRGPCPSHYRTMFGVFDDRGYLAGYISFVRSGPLAIYSRILGHGSHLKNGVMYALHFFVIEAAKKDGIDFIMYGAWTDGTPGLQAWKRHLLFEPIRLGVCA